MQRRIGGRRPTYKVRRYCSAGASGGQGACPLNKIWPPAKELARHNKRFTIEVVNRLIDLIVCAMCAWAAQDKKQSS